MHAAAISSCPSAARRMLPPSCTAGLSRRILVPAPRVSHEPHSVANPLTRIRRPIPREVDSTQLPLRVQASAQ